MLLVRLELASEPCGVLAGLAGLLACLVAFGLGGAQLLSLALGVSGYLSALFLVRLVGCFGLGLDGRQFVAQSVDLRGCGLVDLLLLGQRLACLVGLLVRSVQLDAQLIGAALDFDGAGLGGVRLLLGNWPSGSEAEISRHIRYC